MITMIPDARVISISNQKGGVGKTTTSVSLAAALARDRRRVLLIDMDPQGHVHRGLRKNTQPEKNVINFIIGKAKYSETAFEYSDNLWVMPSTWKLAKVEGIMKNYKENIRYMILKNQLDKIKKSFDYIIIDCQPALSSLTICALVASTHIFIPTNADYLSICGIHDMIRVTRNIVQRLNPETMIGGIILNKFDKRIRTDRAMLKRIEMNFRGLLTNTRIHQCVKLREAQAMGIHIFEHKPYSPGGISYENLKNEIIKICNR